MYVLRPVRMEDLDALVELAELTGFGLTTLPKDRTLLQKRLRASRRAFAEMDEEDPRGQFYLLVLEDTAEGRIVGTSGIVSKVGGFDPFYAYQIRTTVHESRMLGVRKEIQALHLVADHDGPAEIGSLFLHPDHRREDNGRVLSLGRFLLMAESPALFDPTVIAEMRGVVDEAGRSPFWDALGRHFFEMEFPKADYLSIVNKQFIGELMPSHPIYLFLLPDEARQVIGRTHEHTRPAWRLLQKEGFEITDLVDIFEAGPIVRCERDAIRTVRESRSAPVHAVPENIGGDPTWLVARPGSAFRAGRAALHRHDDGSVSVDRPTAESLGVRPGDPVRYAPLRPA